MTLTATDRSLPALLENSGAEEDNDTRCNNTEWNRNDPLTVPRARWVERPPAELSRTVHPHTKEHDRQQQGQDDVNG
jgi:hypothetical protein